MLAVDKRQRSFSVSLPAPVGGLNARDSIANMPETDAVTLDNWFPQTTDVALRHGYTESATYTGQTESILIYTGLAATKVFVGVKDDTTYSVYDATSGGALSSAAVGGSGDTIQALTSTRFDYLNFGNTGGQYLFAVNGADDGLRFDGTTWTAWTVTGVDTDDIFTLCEYAERLWLGQLNTFDVWYLAVNAVSGTATRLNLASLFNLGGSLSNIVTWSADTASELADYIAFVSTLGAVVVFSGTDPSSATTWQRVAHFRIGRPVCKGRRAWTKLGSEAVIICADGLYPLSRGIVSGRINQSAAISDKIRNLINRDIQLHGNRFGWDVCLFPIGNKCIVNVPTAELESSYQYVMNTQTGAWCRFTGWVAFAFGAAGDALYFGGDGFIAIADTGTADDESDISFDAKQAFSYFGQRGSNKHFTMIRPILQYDGPIQLQLSVNVDYSDTTPASTINVSAEAGDPWGGIWDVAWSGATFTYKGWNSLRGIGFCAAPRIKGQAGEVNLTWAASDIVFEPAGIL